MTETVVKRLPAESGTSGWEAISRRSFPVRTLDGGVSADWLIVGAGFAGLSAARRLAQLRPGDKIVVLEAGEIAKGTSGRNSGYMIDVPHNLSSGEYSVAGETATRTEIAENRFAIAFAADAAAEYGMSVRTFDPAGKINAAATERGMKLNANYGRSLEGIGEEHRFLDAAEMQEITGSSYYLGGLYTPGTVMIQPADYIRGFAAGLASKADIFEHSPVLKLERRGGMWKAESRNGSVTAPKAILGINGHIEDFGHFRGRLMHIFTYASMTAPFTSRSTGKDRWALLPADPMGATVRKITSDGSSRVVIRTRFTYDWTVQVGEKRLAGIAAEQRTSLDARFPDLKDVQFEHVWAGRLCLSRNHVPAFGEVDKGLYSACCENGLGTVKSTLAGVMAADLATGTHSHMLDEFSDQPVPARLPPEPLAWLGVNTVIRLQELRAGREG
ncbi:MAG: FAD-binding oxidoreductase [Mesorhizobium sp.]|uniref:NAD(P)/FAD-dependent oxidoreductase n=1 Tax=Mesorhizobium sp. TaxID=1871066 RepID=UPI000FE7535D|nr:FAD-binding oxidoreductase [Mesorhizobium sp.]RWO89883.1 MAG: FAD-binding oxidoreductase [Mesorhizobium sp.]RWP18313.1 MAG: FAD-binding oxidoreductase [Mesorhizobium sp.]RWQ51980.1 MAG: FAD-binding oxidoreductase [Mesorhizobium sp.]TIL71647.1 MAG: FAD-binding oxidoreductase [Mesorhizobium sp.]TIL85357.1 MAG: FAD-binding oxidoreductase [Mesorhizobium sp.]